MLQKKIAVLADDLTGACDTGVQFKKQGSRAAVYLKPDFVRKTARGAETFIFDTESRADNPSRARKKVRDWCRQLKPFEINHIYKKIDSTLRGNIGVEIDEIMTFFDKKAAFIAPAYPEKGRTTRQGYHYVDDTLLAETEYGADLLSPLQDSFIPDILKKGGIDPGRVKVFRREQIQKNDLLDQIRANIAQGRDIFIFDAQTREDLGLLAEKLFSFPGIPLFCGSAGLAEELAPLWLTRDQEPAHRVRSIQKNRTASKTGAGKIVVLAGSVRNKTTAQLRYLHQQKGVDRVMLKTAQLLAEPQKRDQELNRVFARIDSLLQENDRIIISLTKEKWSKTAAEIRQDSKKILASLREVAGFVVDNFICRGFVLTGGDTALNFCRAMGVPGLHIIEEVEPGIPAVNILGGRLAGRLLVTKAGGFGKKDSLLKALRYIEQT